MADQNKQPDKTLEILYRTFDDSIRTARALNLDMGKLVHYAVAYYADVTDLDLDTFIQSMSSGALSSTRFGDGSLDTHGKPLRAT